MVHLSPAHVRIVVHSASLMMRSEWLIVGGYSCLHSLQVGLFPEPVLRSGILRGGAVA